MNAFQPLHFAIVCLDPQATDAVEWSLHVGAGLRARGHAVTIVAPASAVWLQRVRAIACAVQVQTQRSWKPQTWFLRPAATAAFDAVLVSRADFVRAAPRPALGAVLLLRWQSGDPLSGKLPASARVLVGAASESAAAAAACSVPADAVRVLREGVRSTWEGAPHRDGRLDAHALRTQLRLPRAAPLLLHAASLRPESDHETVFRAVAIVLERRHSLHPSKRPNLVVLGTGPHESRLRDLSHTLHLNEHVIWVGQRPGLERYVGAADVVLHPGVEPRPARDVLHALGLGTPAIVAASSGTAGIETAVLAVPPAQPEAWADAIERGLDDAAWRERAAAQAPHWASVWSDADMLDDLECVVRAARLRRRPVPAGGGTALLVDRDDTLVHDVPYNGSPDRVALQDAAGRALRWLQDAGIPVIVVSNQSGVARGLHTEADVRAVNARIQALLHEDGAHVTEFYYCPHHPDFGAVCTCRKPEPGMLLQAAAEHGLDLTRCWMVGDSPRDLEAGTRAGARVAGFGPAASDGGRAYARWPELVRDYMRWVDSGGVSQRATKNSRNSRGSASAVARG